MAGSIHLRRGQLIRLRKRYLPMLSNLFQISGLWSQNANLASKGNPHGKPTTNISLRAASQASRTRRLRPPRDDGNTPADSRTRRNSPAGRLPSVDLGRYKTVGVLRVNGRSKAPVRREHGTRFQLWRERPLTPKLKSSSMFSSNRCF